MLELFFLMNELDVWAKGEQVSFFIFSIELKFLQRCMQQFAC